MLVMHQYFWRDYWLIAFTNLHYFMAFYLLYIQFLKYITLFCMLPRDDLFWQQLSSHHEGLVETVWKFCMTTLLVSWVAPIYWLIFALLIGACLYISVTQVHFSIFILWLVIIDCLGWSVCLLQCFIHNLFLLEFQCLLPAMVTGTMNANLYAVLWARTCLVVKFKIPNLSHRKGILHAWSIKSR
jgi:hypothetical protein